MNLFVLRINYGATDTVTVFRNPTDLAMEANNVATATLTTTGLGAFDRVQLAAFPGAGTGTTGLDEIRIGDSFEAVIPEPSTLALAALGSVGLRMLRRRRR